ncbi:MAG TPA: glycosyltransferase family 4 protein [Bryobacteraceae bacterium]|jgi:glycosyltransferase involved in cell wall biosynthesis|nr:glycosyltransferase family 4 protein [Bryobacteraceae bacterium]
MKILLLTQWFDPEPTFKGLLFARELAARGHQVEVLTGFPNYPGGKIYPGYKIRPWRREKIEGISVLRVALYPSHDKSALGRFLNYTSFAISAALIGGMLVTKPDVVHVYHPPATVALAAVVVGFLRKVPFVYDIHDLWPDTVEASGMLSNRRALAMLDKWCRFIYHRAGHISVVAPGFREQLVRRNVSPDKIDVIYNWCDETTISRTSLDRNLAPTFGMAGRFNVMFAGTMGMAQALDSIIEAAALCRYTLPNVQFVLVGGGVERDRLERKARDLELPNVRFLPRQPMSAMGAILELADVLLVHLKAHPLFSITIPSKIQAYMAAGKPMLVAVRGDAAYLVAQSGGGLVCEPEEPASIAATVARFAAMTPEQRRSMGEAGKKFYNENLSLRIGVDRFEDVFARICGVAIPASRHSFEGSASA